MSEEKEGTDAGAESRRLLEQLKGPQASSMSLEERAYLVKLASAWALVDIGRWLRSINMRKR